MVLQCIVQMHTEVYRITNLENKLDASHFEPTCLEHSYKKNVIFLVLLCYYICFSGVYSECEPGHHAAVDHPYSPQLPPTLQGYGLGKDGGESPLISGN